MPHDLPSSAVSAGYLLLAMPVGALLIYALVRWVQTAALKPDPWDVETEAGLHDPEASPVCHHCLTPLPAEPLFCPECGCAVGAYNNLLPYPCYFSLGEVLRTGTRGIFRVRPFTVAGFFVFAVAAFPLFAPLYWVFLLRNLKRLKLAGMAEPASSDDATA